MYKVLQINQQDVRMTATICTYTEGLHAFNQDTDVLRVVLRHCTLPSARHTLSLIIICSVELWASLSAFCGIEYDSTYIFRVWTKCGKRLETRRS